MKKIPASSVKQKGYLLIFFDDMQLNCKLKFEDELIMQNN